MPQSEPFDVAWCTPQRPRARATACRASQMMRVIVGAICAIASVVNSSAGLADEGGVSVWLPGFFGSLAAAPLQPGWSLTSIYYHTSVSAGADVSRAREITTGRLPVNLNVNLSASLN